MLDEAERPARGGAPPSGRFEKRCGVLRGVAGGLFNANSLVLCQSPGGLWCGRPRLN
jgi:hypothetical protein